MESELDKLIKHFQSMYIAHKNGKCDFYDGCLYCDWDATQPEDASDASPSGSGMTHHLGFMR